MSGYANNISDEYDDGGMIDLRRDSLIYGRGEKSPSGLALKAPRESTAHAKSPGLTKAPRMS